MRELNHIEQAIEQTQLDVCFETIALHALTPILRASDAGKLIVPHDVWHDVIASVKQRIAETYFGSHPSLPQEE